MFLLIRKLYRTRLLTVVGLLRLLQAIVTTGINLAALLRIAAKLHPHRIAVIDDREQLTYAELWRQAEWLASMLHRDCGIRGRQKVAIVCRNHAAAVKSIFAASRLGADVFLLNPEMSGEQLLALEERRRFDFYVYDEQLAHVFQNESLSGKSIAAYHPTNDSIDRISSHSQHENVRLTRGKSGNIVVMTGGTTGRPKAASRKPSVFAFVPPFLALLSQVHLDEYRSVYIATPMYHGFGLASLLIGVILATEMHFAGRFDAEQACSRIARGSIEVVTVVPLMLQRMLTHDSQSLSALHCIITGGAALNPALAEETIERLGPRLFNLYGTSEAGFCIMGTPELLQKKPQSIGRPIWGVKSKIAGESGKAVPSGKMGQLCIRSAWAVTRKSWVETGDLAYRDAEGDIFLCGRVDDMIVSGGENVYPIELERVLVQHPDVESVAVVGISDPEFGQRLKAVVVRRRDATLEQSTLADWLRPRVARYQMPAVIEFRDELPHTPLGKIDSKSLRA
jgi:acyl-CoA synthetase (AMP-forming)/AMP-acid ligase II